MHVERAREFFLSARERLAHLPEGTIYIGVCVIALTHLRSIQDPSATSQLFLFQSTSPPFFLFLTTEPLSLLLPPPFGV